MIAVSALCSEKSITEIGIQAPASASRNIKKKNEVYVIKKCLCQKQKYKRRHRSICVKGDAQARRRNAGA
jgi:hypothetical protein